MSGYARVHVDREIVGVAAKRMAPASAVTEAPKGTFSIAVIPDTQRYHGPSSNRDDESGEPRNPAFESRTIWLADNLDSQRIVFVKHMGDIVDINNHYQQLNRTSTLASDTRCFDQRITNTRAGMSDILQIHKNEGKTICYRKDKVLYFHCY